jgi:hypothetical protein
MVTVWLACLGWLLPIPEAGAAERAGPGAVRAVSVVYDVRLDEDDSFSGRLLDPSGRPLAGQTVLLRKGGKTLAQSRSGDRGEFSFGGVRAGVYQVTIGASAVACRAWTERAAPPAATSQLAIVTHPDVIRGQQPISCLLSSPLFVGLIIAAAIAIPVAIHNSQDDAS